MLIRGRSLPGKGRAATSAVIGLAIASLLGAETLLGTAAAATSQAAPTSLAAGSYLLSAPAGTLARLGVVTDESFPIVNAVRATLTSDQATALDSDPAVDLRADTIVSANAQVLPPAPDRVEADLAPEVAGDGVGSVTGIAMAVVDSGVSTHTDLNVAGGVDCAGGTSYADVNGHGTGVAGAAAARDNAFGIVGVAPGTPIYAVRVLDKSLKGTTASLLCGLDWIANNAATYGIKVVDMSLGTAGSDDGNCGYTNEDLLHQAICRLTAQGISVVASAGNNDTDLARGVPGSYDEVLTATNVADFDGKPGGLGTPGCTTPDADDQIDYKSNYAVSEADKAHTISAPGVCPYTTKKGNQYGYITTGTSLSAAIAAGATVQCRAPGGLCEGLTPADTIRVMRGVAALNARVHGTGFLGDPEHPIAPGKYFGNLVSTRFDTVDPPPTATPSPSGSPSATPSPSDSPAPETPSPSVEPSPSLTPWPSAPSVEPSPSVSPSVEPSPSVSPSVEPSPSVSPSPEPSPSVSPSPEPSPSVTPTAGPSPTPDPSPTLDPSPTPGPSPTSSPSPTPTETSTPTPSPTPTPSESPSPSVTPTPSVTPSATPSPAPTAAADTKPPVITMRSPVSNGTYRGLAVLSASVTDASPIGDVRFLVSTTLLCIAQLDSSTGLWSCTYDTRSNPNGTYSVVARAVDASGNAAQTAAVRVKIAN